MTIVKRTILRPTIDLAGPDGNAFALLGYARRLSKQLGLDYTKIEEEMTENNYDNLVKVFDKHFGQYVVLLEPGDDEGEE
jgi:hypothetical protein